MSLWNQILVSNEFNFLKVKLKWPKKKTFCSLLPFWMDFLKLNQVFRYSRQFSPLIYPKNIRLPPLHLFFSTYSNICFIFFLFASRISSSNLLRVTVNRLGIYVVLYAIWCHLYNIKHEKHPWGKVTFSKVN